MREEGNHLSLLKISGFASDNDTEPFPLHVQGSCPPGVGAVYAHA